jgi:hypothetical protein
MKSTKITAQGMGRDSFWEEIADFLEKVCIFAPTSRNHKTKIMY